jgi:hypothetical protein
VEGGIILKSSDQKTRAFLVLIVLPWWVLGHPHQLFGEMCVRHLVACWFGFGFPKSRLQLCMH